MTDARAALAGLIRRRCEITGSDLEPATFAGMSKRALGGSLAHILGEVVLAQAWRALVGCGEAEYRAAHSQHVEAR
mgnify:CR=1 FL=1